MARSGLIPFWMKEKPKVPHINARAETVDRLPLFREAFAKRVIILRLVHARGIGHMVIGCDGYVISRWWGSGSRLSHWS
jgi:hypothetical protein